MPYIGNQPSESFTSFATQEFSTSATTSYTLDHAVTNENEIALFINNVRQQPGSGKAYTATGTALTLSAATASTDTMYCVFLGRALQTVTPATNSITAAMVGNDLISGKDALASEPADTDEFLVSDAGTLKRIDYSLIKSSFAPDGAQVFNESGADVDFRIESDDNTHGFFFEGDSGNTYIGSSSGSIGSVGVKLFGTDDSTNKAGINIVTAGANDPLALNRSTGDGDLISFRSEITEEGTISVSGTTVSYNGFTGTHWSRFTDNSTPSILRGTVLETLDEMVDWYNLEFEVTENEQTWKEKIPHVLANSETVGDTVTYNHKGKDYQATIVKEDDIKHMKSKVSDTANAKNVYGVFNCWEQGDEGYNDFLVASVGSFVVRIKSGESIAKGDLLQSNGDGTAKVQSDDNIKSSSFAKVLSTTVIQTYEDGSFIVPCSLMC